MKKLIILFLLVSFFSCEESSDNFSNSFNPSLSNAEFDGIGFIGAPSGDQYAEIEENPFIKTKEEDTSTFSVDTDGASYANTRRYIAQEGRLPPKDAVRTEELVNYFNLDYEYNPNFHPISVNAEISSCMWKEDHKLLRIGIKADNPYENAFPPSNYVFLIDVSGSMSSEDKLGLLKTGFKLFVDELGAEDQIAIVTYAGSWGLVLESTSGDQKQKIKNAIDRLEAGGSTAGSEGILSAYEIAEENFIPGGNNRIIIGTDGDFNVGVTDHDELVELIEDEREKGIFITVLGVGRGNLNDATLEQIADNGNGNYEYLDSVNELKKVFIYERSKFFTLAKDTKIQIEFNKNLVEEYRLIGYENRVLENEDFEDDKKDAGDIAAGQNVTALYELKMKDVDTKSLPSLTIDIRYKRHDSNNSVLFSKDVYDEGVLFSEATDFQKFTASVASFGLLIRDSEHKGDTNYGKILNTLDQINIQDKYGLKAEFRDIVELASSY